MEENIGSYSFYLDRSVSVTMYIFIQASVHVTPYGSWTTSPVRWCDTRPPAPNARATLPRWPLFGKDKRTEVRGELRLALILNRKP